MITVSVDHIQAGRNRLMQQYKKLPTLDAIMVAILGEVNALEVCLFGMYTTRSLQGSTGYQLDLWGELLDVLRNGKADTQYRIQLYAKIGENVSSGTADDVANVYNLLTQARYTSVVEDYPAAMNLTAIGANFIGSVAEIKAAVLRSTAAGVSINTFTVGTGIPFIFNGFPDPQGQGFGSLYDSTIGGTFASIV